ncbi:ParA family protein [Hydrogenophaga sp. ZJX-1]|uniref:ParA family protein n=1 Tax=Hydrogenophaga sp. ZJX-1 TaxID=3404778 RepID=UPI003B284DC8
MLTFDQILPTVTEALRQQSDWLRTVDWVIVNRDLFGKIRLVVPEALGNASLLLGEEEGTISLTVERRPTLPYALLTLTAVLSEQLGQHAYPPTAMVLFELDRMSACRGASSFLLDDFENVWVVDRLATEGDWASIAPVAVGVPRVVFFSIKGGVGRSTALSATAWRLAQAGKRVLVLDLDLESPGLSTSLLPDDRQPAFGITDWLVEDLVDNSNAVFDDLIATSTLSHDGEIYVVPAHGAKPGDYVAKLGRVWMPKVRSDGTKENWSDRLKRLIDALEARVNPDVILIDSRAGIDEVASSCVTDLGAKLVLLFALEGSQTWAGYRILFEHWLRRGVAAEIRERLQIVGALLPETDEIAYLEGLRERAADLFSAVYDAIPPGESTAEWFHYEEADTSAPHYPWGIKWHRSFVGLRSLDGRLAVIDAQQVQSIFGALINGVTNTLELDGMNV